MAITATLVFQGHNRLRYLIAATAGGGESMVITSTGAATPDLITDSLAGVIKQIANVSNAGYGKLASGVQTQAKARALLLSDDAASVVGPGVPTLEAKLTPRSSASGPGIEVDADASGAGSTIRLLLVANAIATAYLDVILMNAIGA